MKTQFLLLASASLLFAAPLAHAAPLSPTEAYVARAHAQADQRLAQARVDLSAAGVTIKAAIGSEGQLRGVRVVRSSGSAATDKAVREALEGAPVKDAPAGLIGASISLGLGQAAIVQAKNP